MINRKAVIGIIIVGALMLAGGSCDKKGMKEMGLGLKEKTAVPADWQEYKNDGHKLGFTFDKHDFIRYRRVVRKEGTGLFKAPTDGLYPREKHPIGQRHTARFFPLEKIFAPTNLKNSKLVDLPWAYPVDNWDQYVKWMGSEHQSLIQRPNKLFLSYREWNEIGVDNDE